MEKDTVNLFDVIEELVEEKGLERETLARVVCEGILAAYSKKFPDLDLYVDYDKKTGNIAVMTRKTVVATAQDVLDENSQISLKRAKYIEKEAEIDSKVAEPFTGKIGRVEILRARQVIASQIRKVEADMVYNQFKSKEGELVVGTVHKCEYGGAVIKFNENMAFLPKQNMIPGHTCVIGFSVRALLKEVLPEPVGDHQIILDRASDQFVRVLFGLEIPEIYERLIEIKRIVRDPGYKTKIAVISHDQKIDPVGTCVGVGGSRIKPILKEIDGEKIDIIAWTDSLEDLVAAALKPAQIDRVEISADQRVAYVWLDKEQRPLAIGKMGKNISLASRFAGIEIRLMQDTEGQSSASMNNVSNDEQTDEE